MYALGEQSATAALALFEEAERKAAEAAAEEMREEGEEAQRQRSRRRPKRGTQSVTEQQHVFAKVQRVAGLLTV